MTLLQYLHWINKPEVKIVNWYTKEIRIYRRLLYYIIYNNLKY
jgi:hypothetical protein